MPDPFVCECGSTKVMAGDCGAFQRTWCPDCKLMEDHWKDGEEPFGDDAIEVLTNSFFCRTCSGRRGIDLVFSFCLHCPKYG